MAENGERPTVEGAGHASMAWTWTGDTVAYRCRCGAEGRAFWRFAGGEDSAAAEWRKHVDEAAVAAQR